MESSIAKDGRGRRRAKAIKAGGGDAVTRSMSPRAGVRRDDMDTLQISGEVAAARGGA